MTEQTEAQGLNDSTGYSQLESCRGALMLSLKGTGTSLESLGGGDRNGCLCGWPWTTRRAAWVYTSVLWDAFEKSQPIPGDILGQVGPSVPPVVIAWQGFKPGFLSNRTWLKRTKLFFSGFTKFRIVCETCQ